jgi:hypothetical protein
MELSLRQDILEIVIDGSEDIEKAGVGALATKSVT